eukprot:COSAG01_NODE_1354_length_10598_cov_6.459758_14_plen_67_part_00
MLSHDGLQQMTKAGHLLKAVMPATNSSLVISPSELISRATSTSGKQQRHADGINSQWAQTPTLRCC